MNALRHAARYNGQIIPETIRTCRIISAFSNPIDQDKVERYADLIRHSEDILPWCIPAISGYPGIISQDDVDNGMIFLDGNEVTEFEIGQCVWYVTDGHHRSLAAIETGLPTLCTTMDESTFTIEEELIYWRQAA